MLEELVFEVGGDVVVERVVLETVDVGFVLDVVVEVIEWTLLAELLVCVELGEVEEVE